MVMNGNLLQSKKAHLPKCQTIPFKAVQHNAVMYFKTDLVYKSSVYKLRGFQVTMVSSDLYDYRSS